VTVGHHRKGLRTTAVGAVSATLIAGGVLATAPAAQAANAVRFVDITGDGGTVFKANVVTPADADGTRRYPLLVFPTSWGTPQVEYLAQAEKLANSGYVVVSYNVRGFWQSGGQITRSPSTWTCSPRPTTSRQGTGRPWSSTRSTRSTSSTTRPAHS